MPHNLPLPAPGFYARPLEVDELAPGDFAKCTRPHSDLLPVEIVRLYGEWRCPLSYGKFWDIQSAADFVKLNFN